jgi:hypothetical protein
MPLYSSTNAPDATPKPKGGFTFAPVDHLLLACQAYQQDLISTRGLQADCGLLVMQERRHAHAAVAGPGTRACFTARELHPLLGTPRLAHAERAIEELRTVGLVPMTQTSLAFSTNPQDVPGLDRTAFAARRAHVPATLRRVPFPRRFLRYLAREGSAGLIATAFCVGLRCLRYDARERLCTFGGTVPARWIVATVGLSERSVYRHLATLEALRWLVTADRPTWDVPTDGPWRLVNQEWTPPPSTSGARRPRGGTARARRPRQLPLFPLPAPPAADTPPTPGLEDMHQPPPRPAGAGCTKLAGPSCTNVAVSDRLNTRNDVESRSTPVMKPFQEILKHQFRQPAPPADTTPTAGLPSPPALPPKSKTPGVQQARHGKAHPGIATHHFTLETLHETAQLLQEAYIPAVQDGLFIDSAPNKLNVIGLAVYALRIATHNAPGLFATLLRRLRFGVISNADDEAAHARLKRHDQALDPSYSFPLPEARAAPCALSPAVCLVLPPSLEQEEAHGADIRAAIEASLAAARMAREPARPPAAVCEPEASTVPALPCAQCGRGGWCWPDGECEWCLVLALQARMEEKKRLYAGDQVVDEVQDGAPCDEDGP